MEVTVTGDAEATVGLVAVDKAVYVLNSKHKLTQKKVRTCGFGMKSLPRHSSWSVTFFSFKMGKINGCKELMHSGETGRW